MLIAGDENILKNYQGLIYLELLKLLVTENIISSFVLVFRKNFSFPLIDLYNFS